jgi:hypothetical protein
LRPPTIPLEFKVFKRAKDPYYQLKKQQSKEKVEQEWKRWLPLSEK